MIFFRGATFDWFLAGLLCSHNLLKINQLITGQNKWQKITRLFFSINPRNPSFFLYFQFPESLLSFFVLSFFLVRTLSSYYGMAGFPVFPRIPLFLLITRQLPTFLFFSLSIPESPPFLLITGQVPTFLFFVNHGNPFFPSLSLGNMRPTLHYVR